MRFRALVLALAACAATPAGAQDYPAKPVRIVVPFAPGGGTDILARLLSQRFFEYHGHAATVDNRAGAGGNIGAEIVAKSPPDGYTLMFSTASVAVNVTLYPKMAFDIRRDFLPVSLMASAPLVLTLHPSVPVKSVKELVQIAKTRKGGVNFGSNGNGTTSHLSGLLFSQLGNAPLTHIPYKGAGAAINAMLTGEVDMAFLAAFSGTPHIRSGRLRGLAVTTKQRSPALPELPTLDSMYPGFETDNWFAMFAPAGTPQAIVTRLHGDIVRATRHPDVNGYIQREGGYAVAGTPAELAAVVNRDIEKYGRLVKASGARPDQ